MLFRVKHVEAAIESEAVDTLLICDSLFRSQNLAERKRYVKIVDSVREGSGTVRIFSSLHVSGERKFRFYFAEERKRVESVALLSCRFAASL